MDKKSVWALNLNDNENNQNDKIEELINLFAYLRDQIEKLNEKVEKDSSKINFLNLWHDIKYRKLY